MSNTIASISSSKISSIATDQIIGTNNKDFNLIFQYTSTTTQQFNYISTAQNNILSTSFSITSISQETQPFQNFLVVGPTNIGNWASTIYLATTTPSFGANVNILGSVVAGQVSYSNATNQVLQLNNGNQSPPSGSPPYFYLSSFSFSRFYNIGSTWAQDALAPSGQNTVGTSFAIVQTHNNTILTTPDNLTLDCASLNITGDFVLPSFNNLTVKDLYASTVNTDQIKSNYISTNTIATNAITTNSITTNLLITTSPLTVPSISTNSVSTNIIKAYNGSIYNISTLLTINNRSINLLFNNGNNTVYGTGSINTNRNSWSYAIDLRAFNYGVYTAVALCSTNPLRTLEATIYWSSTGAFGYNSSGFDNYNGTKWEGSGVYATFTSQTDGGGDTFSFYLYWTIGESYPLSTDTPPTPSTFFISSSTVNYGTPTPIIVGLSSLTGSTITVSALDNISLNAATGIPTFLGNGNIALNANSNIDLMANYDIIQAAYHNISLTANNNVNIGASNINLFPSNYLYISSGSYMNTDVFGDMTTDLGGVYTLTSAEVINLNGSNGIGLNSSNDINLTATSNINLNGAVNLVTGFLNMNSNNINNLSNVNFNAAGTGNLTVDSSYQPSYSASNGTVYGRIPLTQFGTANMRSNVASNVVTLPIAYQDTSYVVNVSLNSNAALSNLFISATVLTSNTFAICQNTTIGSDIRHYFYWITVGQFPTGIPP